MLTKRKAFTCAIAAVAAFGLGLALLPVNVMAQGVITEIIDASGDGAGNPLNRPIGIAVDDDGNVSPSLVCPVECGWHVFAVLKGARRLLDDSTVKSIRPLGYVKGMRGEAR